MYTRLLRSVLATAFSTVVVFGAVGAVGAAQAKAPAQHGAGSVQAAAADGGRSVGTQVVPADTGWGFTPSGQYTASVIPADTGWGAAPSGQRTTSVVPADTGWGATPLNAGGDTASVKA